MGDATGAAAATWAALLLDGGSKHGQNSQLLVNGGSQAVRLPAEFRFDADQVLVRRDEATGDVILFSRPAKSWAHQVALRNALGPVPHAKTFMGKRPLNKRGTVPRDLFDGEAG